LSLSLDHVARRIGSVDALTATSIDVAAGEAVAVLGANGSGKSTLLEIAAGTESPSAGRVLIDSRDVTLLGPSSPSRNGVVHLVQDGSLFATLTVLDTVLLGAGRRRRPGALSGLAGRGPTAPERAAAVAALEAVGLTGFAERRIDALSTGERRRVALAAALAADAGLLLIDEPSAGIAVADRPRLARLLAEVRGRTTMLLVDHDPGFVAAVAGRTVSLGAQHDGVIAAPMGRERVEPCGDEVLSARGLTVVHGSQRVLQPTDLDVRAGELVLVLGHNGAGKSSLLRGLAGMAGGEGRVTLMGRDVSGWPPDRRARAGLCTLLADGHGFSTMRVAAALRVGMGTHPGSEMAHTDPMGAVLGAFPEIEDRMATRVRSLSGGERQLVRVAQAALAAPSVLLFDELSLGLAPDAHRRAIETLLTLRDRGTAIVVSDQDESLSAIADRTLHVDAGRVTA
jgi:ABC-type branched-subunit amino acid transport system ATPase component